MALSDPRTVSIDELRFRPANSNERARAGLDHAFRDVPACSFAGDDGISPYMAADAGIGIFPDAPGNPSALHDDVPDVVRDAKAPSLPAGEKLLRSGFGLSVLLHAALALGVGMAAISLPDDSALLEGETVIAIEFYSETDSDVTTRSRQVEREGIEDAVETEPAEQKAEPAERAKRPAPVEKPVDIPKEFEPPVTSDIPEILTTTQPSQAEIEAAARQILDSVKIEPLPDTPPPVLAVSAEDRREVEPVEKPVERPIVRKDETTPVEKKPEPKKVEVKKNEKTAARKKAVAREGNSNTDANKGSSTAAKKNGVSRDASQGKSKSRLKGNAPASNYKGLVQRKLERAKKRVHVAGKGSVVVSFTISANGGVVNLKIRKSSGKPAVDKGALDVIRKASPFPAIPPEEKRTSWPMVVPMTFKGN